MKIYNPKADSATNGLKQKYSLRLVRMGHTHFARFLYVNVKGSGYFAGPGKIAPRSYFAGPGKIVPSYIGLIGYFAGPNTY